MLTKSDIKLLDQLITKRVRAEVKSEIAKALKPIKTDITNIKKDIKTLISFFDRKHLTLKKRIERIETHHQLPPQT